MRPLLVLGARNFAPEIADIVSEVGGFQITGFVENLDRSRCGETIEGIPILWIDDVAELAATHLAVCAFGSTQRRRLVETAERMGFRFATIVHPSVRISASTSVGPGSIVGVAAIIGSYARIGRHVLVNRGAIIGHHTEVGDFSSIMPGANIAGSCTIGEGAYVGIGAVIIDHLAVGGGSVVGAGSVVTRDVPPRVQVTGVPARIVKENIDGL
jgi:sugar O-acyltransferase (sialic acid O-acetyltransferase NeuD family)